MMGGRQTAGGNQVMSRDRVAARRLVAARNAASGGTMVGRGNQTMAAAWLAGSLNGRHGQSPSPEIPSGAW